VLRCEGMNKGRSSCATKIVGSVDNPSLTTNRYTIPRSSPRGHAIRNEDFSNNSSASAQVLPRMDNKTRLLHYSPQQFPQRSANAAIAASSTVDKHNNDHGHYTPPPFTYHYAQKGNSTSDTRKQGQHLTISFSFHQSCYTNGSIS
jgi:hypothetical protein